MGKKSLIRALSDYFGSGFRKRIKQAETVREVIDQLKKKLKKVEKRLDDEKDAAERKRLDKQAKVLVAQIKKAKKLD